MYEMAAHKPAFKAFVRFSYLWLPHLIVFFENSFIFECGHAHVYWMRETFCEVSWDSGHVVYALRNEGHIVYPLRNEGKYLWCLIDSI